MKCLIITGVISLSLAGRLFPQLYAPHLSPQVKIEPSDTGRVMFGLFMNNYLKNNEYFHHMVHGYTLFGTLVRGSVAYIPSKHARIEGGVFAKKDFGRDDFSSIHPFFTMKLSKNGYSLLFGNLEGASSHNMIEPLFDYERTVTHYFENGLQLKAEKEKWMLDLWLDWVKEESAASMTPEEIQAGMSFRADLLKAGRVEISIPLQAMVWHVGGQLSNTLQPVESIANSAAGLRIGYKGSGKFLKEVFTEGYYVRYDHGVNSSLRRWHLGTGYYGNITLQTKPGFFACASWWFGHHYLSMTGGGLYQSVSQPYNTYYENYRQLLLFRAGYAKEIFPGSWIDIRFEPYYDVENRLFEFSYSGYITFRKDFGLSRKKNG